MSTEQHEGVRRVRARAAEDRKTANMKFRTSGDLREKIEAAAAKSGRTASAEAEIRLINSFNLEPFHELVFGSGDDVRKFVTNILTAAKTIQDYENPKGHRIGSQNWTDSEHTRVAIRQAMRVLVDHFAPAPPRPADLDEPVEKQSGYTRDLRHMERFGREFAQLMTGQLPELERDLMRQDAAEH